jgi:hypothetical protein
MEQILVFCFFFLAIELSIAGIFFNRVIRPHSVKNTILVTAITNEPCIINTHLPHKKTEKKHHHPRSGVSPTASDLVVSSHDSPGTTYV